MFKRWKRNFKGMEVWQY